VVAILGRDDLVAVAILGRDDLVVVAILDQDDLESVATLDPADMEDRASLDRDDREDAATLDRDAAGPGSEARLPAAKRSEARSHQEVLEDLDRDVPADPAIPDPDVVVDPAIRGQDVLEVAATLDRARQEDDHQAQSDAPDDQEQRERQAHRCNTKFRHVLRPLFYSFQLIVIQSY
jgi:hypothetical protein